MNEKYHTYSHTESNCGILSTYSGDLSEYRTRILSKLKDSSLTVLGALVIHTKYGLLNGNNHGKLICSVISQAPREKPPIERHISAFSSF